MAKKKIAEELELYFPAEFVTAREKDSYDKLKRRTELVLDSIVNGTDNKSEIKEIDDSMLKNIMPKIFIGNESVEIKYDKQFESACFLISQKSSLDAKKLTVLQFYNALDNIKQQAEAESKSYKLKNNRYGGRG